MEIAIKLIGIQYRESAYLKDEKDIMISEELAELPEEFLIEANYIKVNHKDKEYIEKFGYNRKSENIYKIMEYESTTLIFYNPITLTLIEITVDNSYDVSKKDIKETVLEDIQELLEQTIDIDLFNFNEIISLTGDLGLEITVDTENLQTIGLLTAPFSRIHKYTDEYESDISNIRNYVKDKKDDYIPEGVVRRDNLNRLIDVAEGRKQIDTQNLLNILDIDIGYIEAQQQYNSEY